MKIGPLMQVILPALFLVGIATAQNPTVPKAVTPTLPKIAANAAGFAPKGWIVQTQATGDLNGDGKPDLVFVLHQTDKKNIVSNPDSPNSEPIDTNPRILCVAFHNAKDSGYTLVLQNDALIPIPDDPNMLDPFGGTGGLSIKHGAFSFMIEEFAAMGTWEANSYSYTFRFQHNRFELIGYTSADVIRNTGKVDMIEVNFSTRRVKHTVDSEDGKESITWKQLPPSTTPPSIDEVSNGWEFTMPKEEKTSSNDQQKQ